MDGMWLGYGFCPKAWPQIIFWPQHWLFFSAELPPSSGLDLAISYSTLELSKVVPQTSGNQTSENFMEIPKKHTYQTPFHSFRFWYLRYLLGEFEGATTWYITSSEKTRSKMIRCKHVLCIYTVGGLFSERIWQVYWVDLATFLPRQGQWDTSGRWAPVRPRANRQGKSSPKVRPLPALLLKNWIKACNKNSATMILHCYNDERNWTFMHQTYFVWIY